MKYRITVIKPYSTIELSRCYCVGKRAFLLMIAPYASLIGERIGRFYSVIQVEIIINKLGMPYEIEDGFDGAKLKTPIDLKTIDKEPEKR